jgi:HTH-type transcriptional regulator / antitoxin HigA
MTKICGKVIVNVEMSNKFNPEKYGSLLMSALPQVIESDEELKRAEGIITALLNKGVNLSPEEEKLLDLISDLVEKYEDEHYPFPEVPPIEILKFLMEQNDLKQSDLLHVFGSSGIASEVVNGKRSISKAQAKKLAEFFKVSVELFI